MRLHSTQNLNPSVQTPAYNREALGVGIVHLGPGAFHRAHQAVFTDAALAASGGNWRITGLSLRSATVAAEFAGQNGLFSVIERGGARETARVIGSIKDVHANVADPSLALRLLSDPAIKIVSLTVSEKGYCLNPDRTGVDQDNDIVQSDLADMARPRCVPGILVAALSARRKAGHPPFTVMSCDNLPNNGTLTRRVVVSFANRIDPDLAAWIKSHVSFPATMVDRITPARTPELLARAETLLGVSDHAVVETEPFSQWVIEDTFPHGRPDWGAGGAMFVDDVAPYEDMKLRMLNGAHSLLAYAGHLCGHMYVRDTMADQDLRRVIAAHMAAAAQTLAPVSGINLQDYAAQLLDRFANPQIAHETFQIAMDGSLKMPQRIFEPAWAALERGQDLRTFAFATAAWVRFCQGRTDTGQEYQINDPRRDELTACLAAAPNATAVLDRINALPGLVPRTLAQNATWTDAVAPLLQAMFDNGMAATLSTFAENFPKE